MQILREQEAISCSKGEVRMERRYSLPDSGLVNLYTATQMVE